MTISERLEILSSQVSEVEESVKEIIELTEDSERIDWLCKQKNVTIQNRGHEVVITIDKDGALAYNLREAIDGLKDLQSN